MRKFWSGKKLANWQIEGHLPIFIRQCFFLGSVLAMHAAHSPILYPPIDSDQRICQCFTPPNFPMYGIDSSNNEGTNSLVDGR